MDLAAPSPIRSLAAAVLASAVVRAWAPAVRVSSSAVPESAAAVPAAAQRVPAVLAEQPQRSRRAMRQASHLHAFAPCERGYH